MNTTAADISPAVLQQMQEPETADIIKNYAGKSAADWLLAARKYPNLPAKLIAAQIETAKKAKKKLPSWAAHKNIFYPSKLALEQCSSEITARYKAQLIAGQTITDLTGGLGIDSWFMSQGKTSLNYVEPQESLCRLTRHNFGVLKADFELHIFNTTAESYLQNTANYTDITYIDPSRRSASGGRLYSLSDCMPDVIKLQPIILQKTGQLLIKVSPLLDIKQSLALLPQARQVWVVSVAGEVKELLFLLTNDEPPIEVPVTAALLHDHQGPQEFTFTLAQEARSVRPLSLPQKYLYLPDAALLKAGAFRWLAQRFGLAALHQHTHIYTSNQYEAGFPGRILSLQAILNNKKDVKKAFPDRKALVVSKNYPATPEQLTRKFGLQTGGNEYLIAAKSLNDQLLLLKATSV